MQLSPQMIRPIIELAPILAPVWHSFWKWAIGLGFPVTGHTPTQISGEYPPFPPPPGAIKLVFMFASEYHPKPDWKYSESTIRLPTIFDSTIQVRKKKPKNHRNSVQWADSQETAGCKSIFRGCTQINNIQLFQLTLSEEKQKAYKPRPQGNMGFL